MSIACANYKLFKLISTDNHEWFTKRFTKMIRAILTLRNSSKFLNYINLNYVFKLIDNDSWMIKKTWTRKYIRSNQLIFIKLERIVKGEIWLKLRSATRMLIVKKRRRSVKNILITDDLYVSINGQMGRGEERMKAVIRSQIFFFFPDLLAWRYFETTNYHFTRETGMEDRWKSGNSKLQQEIPDVSLRDSSLRS